MKKSTLIIFGSLLLFAGGCSNNKKDFLNGKNNICPNCSFKGEDLSNHIFGDGELNLKSADFSGANLEEFDGSDGNFEKANFSGANLEGFYGTDGNFEKANFSGANLEEFSSYYGNFEEANFSGANLQYANLSGANLINTDFTDADLRGANFSQSNLSGAYFSGSNLLGANFEGAEFCSTMVNGKLIGIEGRDCFPEKTFIKKGTNLSSAEKNTNKGKCKWKSAEYEVKFSSTETVRSCVTEDNRVIHLIKENGKVSKPIYAKGYVGKAEAYYDENFSEYILSKYVTKNDNLFSYTCITYNRTSCSEEVQKNDFGSKIIKTKKTPKTIVESKKKIEIPQKIEANNTEDKFNSEFDPDAIEKEVQKLFKGIFN